MAVSLTNQSSFYLFINPSLTPHSIGNKIPGNGKYKLMAVSNHIGGLSGGHYTAYARSLVDPTSWFEFNDRTVSKLDSFAQVVTSSAYCLFYMVDMFETTHLELRDIIALPEDVQEEKKEEKFDDRVDNVSGKLEKTTLNDNNEPVDKKNKTEESHERAKQLPPPLPQKPHVDLSESAYICDLCSNPIPGGWNGLMEHVKVYHEGSMEQNN